MKHHKIIKHRILVATIFLIFTISLISNLSIITVSSQTANVQGIEAAEKLDALKKSFMIENETNTIKKTNGAIYGQGIMDEGDLFFGENYFLQENLFSIIGLSKDVQSNTADNDYIDWIDDIYPRLSQLKNRDNLYKFSNMSNSELNRSFSIDQFMFIESICQYIESGISEDTESLIYDVSDLVEEIPIFQANATSQNLAENGAYWTAIQNDVKLNNSDQYGLGVGIYDNPYFDLYDMPITSASLWAAAAYAHFVSIMNENAKDISEDDEEYADLMEDLEDYLLLAQYAFSYAENYALDPELNLYSEYQDFQEMYKTDYYASTQIYALLAVTRLYQATGLDTYIRKADSIIDSIFNYFWDSGLGGLCSYYIKDEINRIGDKFFLSYDNQFFAYVLSILAESTGQNDVKFVDFWKFERPVNKYMELAADTMRFLNRDMWINTIKGDISYSGYAEAILADGTVVSEFLSVNTNMLAIYNLNVLVIAQEPFNQFYQSYIYGLIIAAVVIVVIALISKKGGFLKGGKLSREVRGLLD